MYVVIEIERKHTASTILAKANWFSLLMSGLFDSPTGKCD